MASNITTIMLREREEKKRSGLTTVRNRLIFEMKWMVRRKLIPGFFDFSDKLIKKVGARMPSHDLNSFARLFLSGKRAKQTRPATEKVSKGTIKLLHENIDNGMSALFVLLRKHALDSGSRRFEWVV